ncbi:MAG: Rieske (2Fe-2S) protein [Candidatus Acidiferrales bacterium]
MSPESERRDERHNQKKSMIPAIFAFAFAVAAGIAFLYVYWTSHATMLMGWILGLSQALFGAAFVLWAQATAVRTEAIEAREVPGPANGDRQAVFEEFYPAGQPAERRNFLVAMGTAVIAFFVAIYVSLLGSFASPPGPALFGAVWKRDDKLLDSDGNPVRSNALTTGSAMVVFPEGQVGSAHAQTVLVRVEPQTLQLPPDRAGWTPMGYVAYSRVCTHAGCPVGEFQSESNLLLCPCHQSTFSVLDGARPTGGPAARALPQLPLYAGQDGFLHAAGDFNKPPGPGFWRYP